MYCTIFFTRRNFRKKNLLNCMFPSFEETPRNGERHSLQARCPTPAGRRKNILSPIFPNTSPIFPNIFPIFPIIFPIFPLYFPICPQYSQYFPIHPNIPPQAAGQNGPVLSPNQRRAASVRGAREDQQFRFPFSDFSRFLFFPQLLQVQTELLLPRCGQQES